MRRLRDWAAVLVGWVALVTVASLPSLTARVRAVHSLAGIPAWFTDTLPGVLVAPSVQNPVLSAALVLGWPVFAVLMSKGLRNEWHFRAGVAPAVTASALTAASCYAASTLELWGIGIGKAVAATVRVIPALLGTTLLILGIGLLASAISAIWAERRRHSPNQRIEQAASR